MLDARPTTLDGCREPVLRDAAAGVGRTPPDDAADRDGVAWRPK
jgi:hypothetical protein